MADVERFLEAQDEGGAYDAAVDELRRGRKTSHWMWFVFPQIDGLGSSPMARRYAIASWDEADAFLAHPVLGPRVRACAQLVADAAKPPVELLGAIDAVKLRSSMTLFSLAVPEADGDVFRAVLDRWYGGEPDPATVSGVRRWSPRRT